jgi:hypothetical protein
MENLNQLFDKNEDIDIKRKIVEQLLSKENLESKTELLNPLRWSCLDSIRDFIDKHKMNYSKLILEKFIQTSFIYLISKERKGRDEYIRALNALSNFIEPSKIAPTNPMGIK